MYQIVAKPRTGSSLLNLYTKNDNNWEGFAEFFLKQYVLQNGEVHIDPSCDPYKEKWSADEVQEKFDFLNYHKKRDKHFVLKIFPYYFIELGFEDQLRDYLKDYKLITIDRDPFDQFLSYCHQVHTDWIQPHLYNSKVKQIVKRYYVGEPTIENFAERYHIETNFIETLQFEKVFQYEQINKTYLKGFFKTNYEPKWIPFNNDYMSEIDNLREVMVWFDERIKNVI